MDSLTQIALGAAVGESVLGRKVGNKAALVGAICGTLPDLDSFLPYADAVATVTYHRSFSHSIFVLALLAPLVAWVVARLCRQADYRSWLVLVFWVLLTHPLLDGFTVYGTQLLWPFYIYPFSGSTIFIIDPAYTLPLALGVLTALFLQRERKARQVANVVGLGLSTLYLAWTVGAKFHIERRVKEALAAQQIAWSSLLSTPAPFNSLLWRLVIMAEGGYYEVYYHVFDKPHVVDFRFYSDDKTLLEGLGEHWPVQRLQWFTHGFHAVRSRDSAVVMSDLRMGGEPTYNFNYRVAAITPAGITPELSTRVETPWQTEQLWPLLERVLQPIR